jgi:long-chain acyl-CoA synthetase
MREDVAMPSMTDFRWGEQVSRRPGAGTPFLVYEPRLRNLDELFAVGARWSGRDYLVHGERRLRYEEVMAAVGRASEELRVRGLGLGDRVLLLGGNSIPWMISFWAAIRVGAIPVLGNGWWSGTETAHAVRLVEPALVLAAAPPLESIGDVPVVELDSLDPPPAVVTTVGTEPASTYPDEDSPAVVLFTSGSTGLPKGAILSHRALIAGQHTALHLTRRLPHQLPDDHPAEVTLQSGPVFHIGGLLTMLRSWLIGGTVIFQRDRFDPHEVVELIEREGVHRWGGVPTMVRRVLELPGIEDRDLTSVRALTLGGAGVPADLIERVPLRFPNARRGLSQIYGQSEAGGTLTAASARDLAERPGTVGRPLPVVELRIDGPGPDGVGEIVARTPAQMTGYWGQALDDPFTPDGWLRTGDLGRVDGDGYLYLSGRSKDIVIRGGENIAAPLVEAAILGHPDVREVAVVGLPDPDLGEVVAAAVVVAPGTSLESGELVAFAKRRLAYFAVPSRWWIRSTPLPVNDAGKIDKRAIQASFPADAR